MTKSVHKQKSYNKFRFLSGLPNFKAFERIELIILEGYQKEQLQGGGGFCAPKNWMCPHEKHQFPNCSDLIAKCILCKKPMANVIWTNVLQLD